MSDTLDSRRVIRAILKATKAAKELLAAKDREIAAAKGDAAFWKEKFTAYEARIDRVFRVRAERAYERGPGFRRCELMLDLDALKVRKHDLLVMEVAVRLARGITDRGG